MIMNSYLKSIILTCLLVLTGCKQDSLLTGLDQVQANEVVALLLKNNIEASKHSEPKAGYSVMVNASDFSTAVDLITLHNLPSRPQIEVSEMFPADALVSSPRAELARMYSAIEQRLEKTLSQIDGVVSSRVHVSYDSGNGNSREEVKPVHLSALLRTDSTASDRSSLISDAKRIMKNSFANVEYDNISVVISRMPEVNQLQVTKRVEQNGLVPAYAIGGGIILIVVLMLIMFMPKMKNYLRKDKSNGAA
jgi:type III secretion apparatus lipoprotein, YscJ/HrcJ family